MSASSMPLGFNQLSRKLGAEVAEDLLEVGVA
jgi:hypothetical protein